MFLEAADFPRQAAWERETQCTFEQLVHSASIIYRILVFTAPIACKTSSGYSVSATNLFCGYRLHYYHPELWARFALVYRSPLRRSPIHLRALQDYAQDRERGCSRAGLSRAALSTS